MKENNIDKKVVVLSSFRNSHVMKDPSRYNVSYYMMKPFSLESLEMRIKESLLDENVLTFDNDSNVKEESFDDYEKTQNGLSVVIPKCSVVMIRIKK